MKRGKRSWIIVSTGALIVTCITFGALIGTGQILRHPDGSYVVAGSAARPGQSFRIQLIKTGSIGAGPNRRCRVCQGAECMPGRSRAQVLLLTARNKI